MENSQRRRQKSKTTSQLIDPSCRICLEKSDGSTLISPCKCIGSVSFVHEDCLKTWIQSSNAGLKEAKCEICHSNFEMQWEETNVCIFHELFCKNFGKFILLPLVILFSLLLVTLIIKLASQLNQDSSKSEVFSFILIIFSSCVILILLFLGVKIIKHYYIKKRLKKWTIFTHKKMEEEKNVELPSIVEEDSKKLMRSKTIKL